MRKKNELTKKQFVYELSTLVLFFSVKMGLNIFIFKEMLGLQDSAGFYDAIKDFFIGYNSRIFILSYLATTILMVLPVLRIKPHHFIRYTCLFTFIIGSIIFSIVFDPHGVFGNSIGIRTVIIPLSGLWGFIFLFIEFRGADIKINQSWLIVILTILISMSYRDFKNTISWKNSRDMISSLGDESKCTYLNKKDYIDLVMNKRSDFVIYPLFIPYHTLFTSIKRKKLNIVLTSGYKKAPLRDANLCDHYQHEKNYYVLDYEEGHLPFELKIPIKYTKYIGEKVVPPAYVMSELLDCEVGSIVQFQNSKVEISLNNTEVGQFRYKFHIETNENPIAETKIKLSLSGNSQVLSLNPGLNKTEIELHKKLNSDVLVVEFENYKIFEDKFHRNSNYYNILCLKKL